MKQRGKRGERPARRGLTKTRKTAIHRKREIVPSETDSRAIAEEEESVGGEEKKALGKSAEEKRACGEGEAKWPGGENRYGCTGNRVE